MGLLEQMEEEAEQAMAGGLRESLQQALDQYRPSCPTCGLA